MQISDYPECSAAFPDYPDVIAGSSLILLSLFEGLDKHQILPADFLEHDGGFPGLFPQRSSV